MIREGRMFGFALGLLATCLLAAPLRATAGDKPRAAANTTAAPLDIPHTTNLELTARANKKRAPGNIEKPEFLDLDSGLECPDLPEEQRRARATPDTRTAPHAARGLDRRQPLSRQERKGLVPRSGSRPGRVHRLLPAAPEIGGSPHLLGNGAAPHAQARYTCATEYDFAPAALHLAARARARLPHPHRRSSPPARSASPGSRLRRFFTA